MKLRLWSGKKKYFFVLLFLADIFSFALAVLFISKLLGVSWQDPFVSRVFLFSLMMLIIFYSNYDLYKDVRRLFDDTDFMHILYANGLVAFIFCAFILIFDPNNVLMIVNIFLVVFFSVLFTSIIRKLASNVVSYARNKGLDVKRTIFYGDADPELIGKLKNRYLGYKLILVTKNRAELKKHLSQADIVFVNQAVVDEEMLNLMTNYSRVNWKILSSLMNLVIEPVAFDEFKDYPLINISDQQSTKTYLFVKRIMDVVLSGLALLVLFPLFLIVAMFIKLTMPGPVFFTQERLGKNLKPFNLYKFRSMKVNADGEKDKLKNEVNGLFKMKHDPRITRFGRLLRRTCIDELPQLWNIFKGDMSLVGPRPHLERELGNFEGWRRARFDVKPGLTGLWQVNGRHELNFDKAVLYDIYYVRHLSFVLDMGIILRTIPAIIMSKGRF